MSGCDKPRKRILNVTRFSDQYDALSELFGMPPDDIKTRDANRSLSAQRWIAIEGPKTTGSVDLVTRPDGRTFAIYRGALHAVPALTAFVARQHSGPLHASGRESKPQQLEALRQAGFVEEMTSDAFEVEFSSALARLERAWLPSGFGVVSSSETRLADLLTLDNQLRHLVPGTDGWIGDIEWMRSELSKSPPYDPAAYLVAVEEGSDRYVGLVRIWRNEAGPRLGMVGVLPGYRHLPLAARLLQQSLAAASEWGFDTFTTETALTNSVLHPRLTQLAKITDRLHQMVLQRHEPC